MSRVKRGVTAHARHKKILELASGYRGRSNSSFRIAIERVEKGLQYAYRDAGTRSANSALCGSSAATRPPASTTSPMPA